MADDDDNQSSRGTGSKKSSKSSKSSQSAKKSSSKSADSSSDGSGTRKSSRTDRSADAPRAESAPRTSPAKLAANAAQQLLELTGRDVEGIIGLEKGDGIWLVQVEMLEVSRIPNTTDVLAHYEIDADEKGNLQAYRRIRRYVRGAPDEDR